MLTCSKCQAGIPEGMRFCLQCGSSLPPSPSPLGPPVRGNVQRPSAPAPPGPPAPPAPRPPLTAPPRREAHNTVPLKIAATPVMTPRTGGGGNFERPALGDQHAEVDDESLKKSFARQVTQPGVVVCRFCKGPLDIGGEFCEQCGAPVAEAAPPGMIKPKPQPVAPPDPPAASPAAPPSKPAMAAQSAPPPAVSTPADHPSAAPPPPAKPASQTRTTSTRATVPPPSVAPSAPPTPPAEDQSSGLMGRFKGLFKKG
jgi:hypothetical protein